MVGRDEIGALIPHAGSMCLLEHVLDWDDEHIRIATASHASGSNPLRSRGRLRAVHLCEYGAQAMAVHGALLARAGGSTAAPGLLVSLRDVHFGVGFVEDLPGELEVHAERLHATAASWQYAFRVLHAGRELARGRAAVMSRRRA